MPLAAASLAIPSTLHSPGEDKTLVSREHSFSNFMISPFPLPHLIALLLFQSLSSEILVSLPSRNEARDEWNYVKIIINNEK